MGHRYMTDRDKADLAKADGMVAEGKRLRRAVLTRVRVRNHRNRRATQGETDER